MAVAYSAHTNVTAATGASITSGSWAISGADRVLVVGVGLDSPTATATAATWSLGSGTPYLVGSVRSTVNGGGAYACAWAIPAPVAGTGTYTVTLSASVAYQADGLLFTGADQAIPCPVGDLASVATTFSPPTALLTPAHLTATDATMGVAASTIAGNPSGITPNSTYSSTSTSVNFQAGYATGTTGVTSNNTADQVTANLGFVAVRIQSPIPALTVDWRVFPKFLLRGVSR